MAGGAGAPEGAPALEGREAPEGAGVHVEAGVHAEARVHAGARAHAEAPVRALEEVLAGAQVRGLVPATPQRGPVVARARERRRRPAVHPASGHPREVAASLGLVVRPVGAIVPTTGATKDPDLVPTSFQTLSRIDNVRNNYAKRFKKRRTRG